MHYFNSSIKFILEYISIFQHRSEQPAENNVKTRIAISTPSRSSRWSLDLRRPARETSCSPCGNTRCSTCTVPRGSPTETPAGTAGCTRRRSPRREPKGLRSADGSLTAVLTPCRCTRNKTYSLMTIGTSLVMKKTGGYAHNLNC